MSQGVKDFFAGLCSGWAQVIIMMPFDIVKIRLVNDTVGKYKGAGDCLKQIVAEQGPLALYKGTLSPLIGAGAMVSIQFGLNQRVKRFFSKFKKNPTDPLPLQYVAMSGIIAGLGCSVVATPVEHARIRMQNQDKNNKIYSGSIDAGTKIVKAHGIRGLYAGFAPTAYRDSIGSCLYFLAYQRIMRSFVKPGQKAADAPLSVSLFAGGVAGIGYWAFSYPIDYVKTLVQSDNLANRSYRGMLDCINKRKGDGLLSFYKGYGVCMLRSVPVNAGGFYVFEAVMRVLGRSAASE